MAPFSATILRFGAGISFMYIGYSILVRRDELGKIRLPLIGHPPLWLIWIAGLITVLDGLALFVGYGTQAAAILGMLIALKHVSLSGRWATVRPRRTKHVPPPLLDLPHASHLRCRPLRLRSAALSKLI